MLGAYENNYSRHGVAHFHADLQTSVLLDFPHIHLLVRAMCRKAPSVLKVDRMVSVELSNRILSQDGLQENWTDIADMDPVDRARYSVKRF